VATTAGVRKSELPGWFWGALGCMTVLVVGLAIVFFMNQNRAGSMAGPATPPAVVAAPAAATSRTPDVQRTGGPGIKIEPMAAPPSAIDSTMARPVTHAKAPARPLKIAHSPAATSRSAVVAKAPAVTAAADDDRSDDEPKAKPAPRAAPAAAEDEAADDNK
jgi:hypothetical protein